MIKNENLVAIDLDIINMFNNKFNDDYPDVRKPIICNGLKAIKIFKHDCDKKIPTIKEEQEQQTEEEEEEIEQITLDEVEPSLPDQNP